MLLNKTVSTKIASKAIGATRAMSGKEIKFGVEGRAAMLKGVNLLADAVQVSQYICFLSGRKFFKELSIYDMPWKIVEVTIFSPYKLSISICVLIKFCLFCFSFMINYRCYLHEIPNIHCFCII